MYAPKGIVALYVRPGLTLEPVIYGGGQEHGQRAGMFGNSFGRLDVSCAHMTVVRAGFACLHLFVTRLCHRGACS